MSYSIPPYTTIRGMIANALGMMRDELSIQDWITIGIKPLDFSNRSRELAKTLKLISRELKFKCNLCQNKWTTTTKPAKCPQCGSSEFLEIPNYKRVFPSAPMFKEFLVCPAYEIYVAGEDDKINPIYNALIHPARPLYIGASDDLVNIEPSKPIEIKKISAREISGVIEGIHEKCFIEKIPYKFSKKGNNFSLKYKTVSIPKDEIITLKEEVGCWQFDSENIWLI